MFRDRHSFTAICVSSKSLDSVRKAIGLLPQEALSKPERVAAQSKDGFEAFHFLFHSSERFSRSTELDDAKVVWNGVDLYRYDMYAIGIEIVNTFVVILAAPFFSMGKKVFSIFSRNAVGTGLQFHQVALDLLQGAIRAGRHEGGLVRVVGMELIVLGDASVDRIALSGTDVLHSALFGRFTDLAEGSSTILSPRRCRLVYDDHLRPRFGLSTDRYGNFVFRVGKDSENLACGMDLMKYLHREDLIKRTFAFPPARGSEKDHELLDEE